MISNNNIPGFNISDTIKTLGISEEQFFSLSFACQKALCIGYLKIMEKKDNNMKSKLITNLKTDELTKKKVLTIFKRK